MSNYEHVDCTDAVDDLEFARLNYPGLFQRLDHTHQPQITQSPHCIYRTPKLLRKVNEAAYTPRLVSIGPFHYGNEDLQMMEKVKDRYLRNYLDRTQRTLKDILSSIEVRKEELKSYYEEVNLTLSDTSFVEMILLDGVFIIQLFLQMFHIFKSSDDSNEKILQHVPDLMNDLFIMHENQLPWFVIEELYNKDVIQHVPDRKPFLDSALLICFNIVPSWSTSRISGLGVKHLHDLLSSTIIHPFSPNKCLPSTWEFQRLSATVLHEAGVKFKVRESKSFLDIKFHKKVLNMPSFIFDRNTETFARNLMAYEQCHYQDDTSHTYLCDYFYLMDNLINTSKDVDLLSKSGIIINWLGDNDEVATLVNNLSKHVRTDLSQSCYAKLCEDLDGHCRSRWNNWKTTFKRDYLSTPWKVASTVAAIILLLLTLIQTVCSLVSLFK